MLGADWCKFLCQYAKVAFGFFVVQSSVPSKTTKGGSTLLVSMLEVTINVNPFLTFAWTLPPTLFVLVGAVGDFLPFHEKNHECLICIFSHVEIFVFVPFANPSSVGFGQLLRARRCAYAVKLEGLTLQLADLFHMFKSKSEITKK